MAIEDLDLGQFDKWRKKDFKRMAKKMGLEKEDYRPNEISSAQAGYIYYLACENGMDKWDANKYMIEEDIYHLTKKQARWAIDEMLLGRIPRAFPED